MEAPAVRLSRFYPAPPEAVFAAWTDPDLVARWFAPTHEYDAHVDQFDATPGGHYRIEMRHVLGTVHTVAGTFEIVSAPHRLVFSWAWEGPPMSDMGTSRVTVDIAEAEGGATLTLVHDDFASADVAAQHVDGWEGCLWRLRGTLAPDPTHHVATTLALHALLFHNVLRDLSPDDLTARSGEANHATWIAAHIAQSRADLAGLLGEPVADSPLEAFRDAVDDDTPLPDLDAIVDTFRRAKEALYRGLRRATPESLAAPAPFPVPIADPTLGGTVDFLLSHEAYHIGQLSLLRRTLGHPAMEYAAAEPVAA